MRVGHALPIKNKGYDLFYRYFIFGTFTVRFSVGCTSRHSTTISSSTERRLNVTYALPAQKNGIALACCACARGAGDNGAKCVGGYRGWGGSETLRNAKANEWQRARLDMTHNLHETNEAKGTMTLFELSLILIESMGFQHNVKIRPIRIHRSWQIFVCKKGPWQ